MDTVATYNGDAATGVTLLDQYHKEVEQNSMYGDKNNIDDDDDEEEKQEEREKQIELQQLLQNASFDDVLDDGDDDDFEEAEGDTHPAAEPYQYQFFDASKPANQAQLHVQAIPNKLSRQQQQPYAVPADEGSVAGSSRASIGSVTNIPTPNAYSTPVLPPPVTRLPPPKPPVYPVGEVFLSVDEKREEEEGEEGDFTLDHNTYLDDDLESVAAVTEAEADTTHHGHDGHDVTLTNQQAGPTQVSVSGGAARDGQQLKILYEARVRQVQELTQKLDQLEEESGREIRVLKHQITLIQDERDGYKTEIKETKAGVTKQRHEISELRAQIEEWRGKYEECDKEKAELSERLKHADVNIESLHKELACINQSDAIIKLKEQLEKQRVSLTGKYEKQVYQCKQMIDERTQEVEEKEGQLTSVRAQLNEVETRHERLKLDKADTINHLNLRLEESQRQCQHLLEAGTHEEVGQLKAKLQLAEKERQQEACQRKLTEQQKCELEEQLKMLTSSLQTDAAAVDGDNSSGGKNGYQTTGSMKSQLIHYMKVSQQQRAEIGTLTELLDGESERVRAVQGECDAQRAINTRLQEQLDSVSERLRSYEESQSSPSSRCEELERLLSECKRERVVAEGDVQSLKSRVSELEESEDKLTAVNRDQNQRLSALLQQAVAEREQAVQRCKETYEQRLSAMSSECDDRVSKLSEQLTRHEQELHMAKTDYITLCKERNELERALQNYKGECAARERLQHLKQAEEKTTSLEQMKAQCMREAERTCERRMKEAVDKQVEAERKALRSSQQQEIAEKVRSTLDAERERVMGDTRLQCYKEYADRYDRDISERDAEIRKLKHKHAAVVKSRFRQVQEKLREKDGEVKVLRRRESQRGSHGPAGEDQVTHLHELYSGQMEDMRRKHQRDMEGVRSECSRELSSRLAGLYEFLVSSSPGGTESPRREVLTREDTPHHHVLTTRGESEPSEDVLTSIEQRVRQLQQDADKCRLEGERVKAHMCKLNKTYLDSLEKVKDHCCTFIDKNGDSVKDLLLKVSECERQRLLTIIRQQHSPTRDDNR